MSPETEPFDVLTIGEMVVDFISVERTDTLSHASTFERHLGGSPANVAVSDNGNLRHVGPLPKVEVSNVTGARESFWSALLLAHLDGKNWPEAVHFAHEVASLKLRVEGHVERMIDREGLYAGLKSAGRRGV